MRSFKGAIKTFIFLHVWISLLLVFPKLVFLLGEPSTHGSTVFGPLKKSPSFSNFLPKASREQFICYCNDADYIEQRPVCRQVLEKVGLVNYPTALLGDVAPCVRRSTNDARISMVEDLLSKKIEYSVVLIVFNQEQLVPEVVSALLENTKDSWELIVIFDYCTDNSIASVEEALLNFGCMISDPSGIFGPQTSTTVHQVTLVEQRTPIFETVATNLGLLLSRGEFAILVQDDMVVKEGFWNVKLAGPAKIYEDVAGVSARCAHSYKSLQSAIGVDCGHKGNLCTFYVRDTCNRGPLLLRMSHVRLLGYFDERNFFLGDDGYDFFARAWKFHGLVGGYMPGIDFDHRIEYGGSRKRSQTKTQFVSNWTRHFKRTNMGGGFLSSLNPLDDASHNEERNIPRDLCLLDSPTKNGNINVRKG